MGNSIYQMVADRIINELENGVIPWQKPWTGGRCGAYNRISRKPYSLINQFMLKHPGEYATFNQWKAFGGKIRKGEKSEFVVFWKIVNVETANADGTKEVKQVPMLRYYNVFHVSQVDGVEPLDEPFDEVEPVAEADQIIIDYVTREQLTFVEEITDEAYYSPSRDLVHIPTKEQYTNIAEYYGTAFHELTHSTGHTKRLNRLTTGVKAAFGGEEYSKEELVAEIGSANLLNLLGIETSKSFQNSTAYIKSWLKVLRGDSKIIISAASKAEKAVNYILGTV